jgi:S1-C subfamily serine protease
MDTPSTAARAAFLSSLLTLTLIIAGGYALRAPLAEYLYSQIAVDDAGERPVDPETAAVDTTYEPVVETVAQVKPAVVSIVATKDVPIYERYYETFDPWGFFGGFTIPRLRENGTEEQEVGGGSGFIVTREGHVVTNHHVVADPEARYSVLLDDGTSHPVTVLDSDPSIDIAVVKIEAEDQIFPVAAFGDSNNLRLGQTVIAIGNVLAEFQNSVSVGVVSGLSRSIVASDSFGQSEELHQVIQTDAAINPGNSGGPLLNLSGEVIGVNVATSRGADNIGFAMPSALVAQAVSSVIESGEIIRPYLGVRYVSVTEAVANANDLPVQYGALIVTGGDTENPPVLPNSPAAAAGLQEGDVIVALDGESLRNQDLATVLRTKPIGVPFALEVLRDGEYIVLEVTLTAFSYE